MSHHLNLKNINIDFGSNVSHADAIDRLKYHRKKILDDFEREVMNTDFRYNRYDPKHEFKRAQLSRFLNRDVSDNEVHEALKYEERLEKMDNDIKMALGIFPSWADIVKGWLPEPTDTDKLFAFGRGCGKTPRIDDIEDTCRSRSGNRGGNYISAYDDIEVMSPSDENRENYSTPVWLNLPMRRTPLHFKPPTSNYFESWSKLLDRQFLRISKLKNNKSDMKNFNCGDTVFFFIPTMERTPKVGSGVINRKRTDETIDGKMEIEYQVGDLKLLDGIVFGTKADLLASL